MNIKKYKMVHVLKNNPHHIKIMNVELTIPIQEQYLEVMTNSPMKISA